MNIYVNSFERRDFFKHYYLKLPLGIPIKKLVIIWLKKIKFVVWKIL